MASQEFTKRYCSSAKEYIFSSLVDWIDYTNNTDYSSSDWQFLLSVPLMTEEECEEYHWEQNRMARAKIQDILNEGKSKG